MYNLKGRRRNLHRKKIRAEHGCFVQPRSSITFQAVTPPSWILFHIGKANITPRGVVLTAVATYCPSPRCNEHIALEHGGPALQLVDPCNVSIANAIGAFVLRPLF